MVHLWVNSEDSDQPRPLCIIFCNYTGGLRKCITKIKPSISWWQNAALLISINIAYALKISLYRSRKRVRLKTVWHRLSAGLSNTIHIHIFITDLKNQMFNLFFRLICKRGCTPPTLFRVNYRTISTFLELESALRMTVTNIKTTSERSKLYASIFFRR